MIQNIKNHKIYIGRSKNIIARWTAHKSLLNNNKHPNKHLQASWNKYGSEFFEFVFVEKEVLEEKLIEREQYWIDIIEAYIPTIGYNLSPSAKNNHGVKYSKETKQKLSNINKKRIGKLNAFYGKKHSEETKKKISLARKGNTSQKGRKNNYDRWIEKYGKEIADEKQAAFLEKMKKIMSGKNNPFYGKTHKEETKEKLSKKWKDKKRLSK